MTSRKLDYALKPKPAVVRWEVVVIVVSLIVSAAVLGFALLAAGSFRLDNF